MNDDTLVCTSEAANLPEAILSSREGRATGGFAAACLLIAGLPLLDAEKAKAVRQLLSDGIGC